MDVGVMAAAVLGSLLLTLGIIVPLAARAGARRRKRQLEALATSLGGTVGTLELTWLKKQTAPSVELTVDGQSAVVTTYATGRTQTYVVGMRVGPLPHLVVRRETGRDRFGKLVGLNREVQTDDAGFDRDFYLETDEPEDIVQSVLFVQPLREAIRAALPAGINAVRLSPGLVSCELIRPKPPTADELKAALARLAPIAKVLPQLFASQLQPLAPARGDRLMAVVAIAFACSMVGGAVLPRGYADYWAPLMPEDVDVAAGTALLGWLVSIPLCWWWVKGHSRSLRNFLCLVIFSLHPVLVIAPLLAHAANAGLDGGEATELDVDVLRRSYTGGKSDHRELKLEWEAPHPPIWVSVSRKTYDEFHPGDTMHLVVRPGALGWPWAKAMTVRSRSPFVDLVATITSAQGGTPARGGMQCPFRVSLRPPEDGTPWCQAELRCADKPVFGSSSKGYFECDFTADPPAVSGHRRIGEDPAMELDTQTGRLVIWDDRGQRAFRVEAQVHLGAASH